MAKHLSISIKIRNNAGDLLIHTTTCECLEREYALHQRLDKLYFEAKANVMEQINNG